LKTAAVPHDEEKRLAALRQYQLLDSPRDGAYDAFLRLAAEISESPIALISLVDRDREWFKARFGIDLESLQREYSFCADAVTGGRPVVIRDASADPRFRDNPLVAGSAHVRFYAGFPLRTPQSQTIGMLAVLDRRPRELKAAQLRSLSELADAVTAMFEERRTLLQLFDATYNELLHVDAQTGRFLFASDGAQRVLGYSLAELIGMHVGRVLQGMSESRFQEAVQGMREGAAFVAELSAHRKDGSQFPVELHAQMQRSGGGEQILAVAVDVTERKAAQRQIDLLLSAVNVAGDSVLVFEIANGGELRVAYANDAFYKQTGYRRGEVLGAPLEQFRKEMPDDPGMQTVRHAFATGEAVKAEVCSYRKDGSSFWNQITIHPVRSAGGDLTHWISVERDVTEAVERQSRLAEQNLRLVRLGVAARELFGVLELGVLERRLKASVRSLTGGIAHVHPVEPEPFADELLARALRAGGRAVDAGNKRIATPAGNAFVVDVTAAKGQALHDTDILVVELLGQYFGVAAQNASLVAEIEEQRNAVLELNQVKTDLIAMLAHDFKGPVTNILGYADLAGEMGELNEHQSEYLEAIKRAALRLADLATDTLALSRLERNEIDLSREDVDLAALVRDVADAHSDQREIRVDARGDVAVHGDARRLRQVFYNLIENAIKYSPGDEPVDVLLYRQGDTAVAEVTDRGIGVPKKDVRRIFDRFARASNARKMRISGTGFGLFLARQIAEMHGGRIDVESSESRGSTFRVVLPLAGYEELPRALRVAVIEREAEPRSFIAHALREAGFRTRVVQSLEPLVCAEHAEVDRIVVDLDAVPLQPPDLAQLQHFARSNGIGVVLVASEVPASSDGAHVIRKPYLMRDLLGAVQSPPMRSSPE
jgi:PAS domain S-box-containing protein